MIESALNNGHAERSAINISIPTYPSDGRVILANISGQWGERGVATSTLNRNRCLSDLFSYC